MEQNSQVDRVQQIQILEGQIRECYGRVVYTHKTQEKCADIVYKLHKNLKIFEIVISAIVTTSILVVLFGDNKIALFVGALLSSLQFGLNAYTKDYDLGEIAQKHTSAANELWDIRETYLSLLSDLKADILSVGQITHQRDELQKRLLNVYTGSPRTNNKAYKLASQALQKSEEMTFNDKEIDAFLPKGLRKSQL